MYGLTDASRNWYLTIKDTLISLGSCQTKVDKAFFTCHEGDVLCGIIVLHDDDFLYAGTETFIDSVIGGIRQVYVISAECADAFMYVGLELNHCPDGILLSQQRYANTLSPIEIESSRKANKHDFLTDDEKASLRRLVGQINWIANHTRPDVCFDVLKLSNVLTSARVVDLISANKTVKKIKNSPCVLLFPRLSISSMRVLLYNDAAWANLSDGISSTGGRIFFLSDEGGSCCAVSWSSTKIKRVVTSSLSAEAHSLVDGLDTSHIILSLLKDVLREAGKEFNVNVLVDSLSLVQNVHSTTLIKEKRIRVNIASIQESVEKNEVSLEWIDRNEQLADCLTKSGADSSHVLHAVSSGELPFKMKEDLSYLFYRPCCSMSTSRTSKTSRDRREPVKCIL